MLLITLFGNPKNFGKKGFMKGPNPKPRKCLLIYTVKTVHSFYETMKLTRECQVLKIVMVREPKGSKLKYQNDLFCV